MKKKHKHEINKIDFVDDLYLSNSRNQYKKTMKHEDVKTKRKHKMKMKYFYVTGEYK